LLHLSCAIFFHSQWFLFDDVPDFCAFLLACHRGTFCLTVAIAMFPRCCLSLGAAAAEGAWLGHDGISGNLYMHATGRQDGGMGWEWARGDWGLNCPPEPDKVKSTFAIPASLTGIRSHAISPYHRYPYRCRFQYQSHFPDAPTGQLSHSSRKPRNVPRN